MSVWYSVTVRKCFRTVTQKVELRHDVALYTPIDVCVKVRMAPLCRQILFVFILGTFGVSICMNALFSLCSEQ